MDLEATFEEISHAYRNSPGGPIVSAREQLTLYALYKQATVGDAQGPVPPLLELRRRARYRSWQAHQGMASTRAMDLYVRMARRLGYKAPGPSPVPWISSETWRREESWTDPKTADLYPAVSDPHLIVADLTDRHRAPKIATSSTTTLPPAGPLEEHLRRLQNPPQAYNLLLFSPVWPVCCHRLTTLVGRHQVDEVFLPVVSECHFITGELLDGWNKATPHAAARQAERPYGHPTLRDGVALYHCTSCGSVYVASFEP